MIDDYTIAKTCGELVSLFDHSDIHIIKRLFANHTEPSDPDSLILVTSGNNDYGFSPSSDIIFMFSGSGQLVSITERIDIHNIKNIKEVSEYRHIGMKCVEIYKHSPYIKATCGTVGKDYIDINYCRLTWYELVMQLVNDKVYDSVEDAIDAANNGEQIHKKG